MSRNNTPGGGRYNYQRTFEPGQVVNVPNVIPGDGPYPRSLRTGAGGGPGGAGGGGSGAGAGPGTPSRTGGGGASDAYGDYGDYSYGDTARAKLATSLGQDTSPSRPERSRRRGPAEPAVYASPIEAPRGLDIPPLAGGDGDGDGDLAIPPMSPSASSAPGPGGLGLSIPPASASLTSPVSPLERAPGDVWAREREQRNAARQQSTESAAHAAQVHRSATGHRWSPPRGGKGNGAGAGGGNAAGNGTGADGEGGTSSPAANGANADRLRHVVGAFMAASRAGREEAHKTVRRQQTIQRENWDDLVQGPTGGKFAEIDNVLRKIRKDWPFIMDGDFSPSSLALSLLSKQPDGSNPSHPDLDSFKGTHAALSASLQNAVQAHYQTFAASLPTHANFAAALERAQGQVKTSRDALKIAREGISGKGKAELASVRARERLVREMLNILDVIDDLKKVPEQLESFIQEKRFLQAALLLVRSLKTINREDIRDIGAVADLRQYFSSQESALTDILVEELHTHLYLKSFNSELRWRLYIPGQQDLPVIEPDYDEKPVKKPTTVTEEESSRFSFYLNALAVKPNQEPLLNELDPSLRRGRTASQMGKTSSMVSMSSVGTFDHSNNETDSFNFMETLLEALAALGKLGSALDTLVQRIPTEVHALIDVTIDEVEERTEERAAELDAARPPSVILAEQQDLENMPLFHDDTMRVIISLDTGPPKNAFILRDLLWTLYSKLSAVMEGHRVVFEVSKWIASRRDFKDNTKPDLNLNVPVLEIWRPVQTEVQSLLQTYLKDEQGSVINNTSLQSVNEVLREGAKIQRDPGRELFKFGDTDVRAVNNEIKEIDDALKQTLRASVPGLINLQTGDNVNIMSGSANQEDKYSAMGSHRTLVPPNPFNVTVLFQPTLAFIQRSTIIAPPGFEDEMSQFGTVLDNFVKNVFLPQLKEKVTASFQQAVSGYDAFQVDRRSALGLDKPPIKSSVRVMALVQSLCAMLQESPFHKENYSDLILNVIQQYCGQCSTRHKDLVTIQPGVDGAHSTALPDAWAQKDEMIRALRNVHLSAVNGGVQAEESFEREIRLEMSLLGGKPPLERHLINSGRKLEALGNLVQTMRWFVDSLLQLADNTKLDKLPPSEPLGATDTPRLPLTNAMAQRFSLAVRGYQNQIESTLNTLRLEVRCRVLCNLFASLQRGEFVLDSEALEPDPDVLDLNMSLIEMDEIASRSLSAADKDYVFRGLSSLIDHVFVAAARHIKRVNRAGANKIRRNILSLQQTLRGIVPTDARSVLVRAADFWDLYSLGPKAMLDAIDTKAPQFAFEDYNAMLALQCPKGNGGAGDDLNTYLIDLHALSMSIEGWDEH